MNSECACIADCERLSFTFTEKEWPIRPDDYCKPGTKTMSYVAAKLMQGGGRSYRWKYDKKLF